MGRIKSIYISAYLTLATGCAIYATVEGLAGDNRAWIGAMVSLWGVLSFFGYIFVANTARTSDRLAPMIVVALAGALLAMLLPVGSGNRTVPLLLALLPGLAGALVYVFWYSKLDRGDNSLLQVGLQLPEFQLEDTDGRPVSSAEFLGRPTLWMFYRGNWCPLCSAQIRELVGQYLELEQRGVEVVLVSPQSHENSRQLAERFAVSFRFLVDPDVRAGRSLGIGASGGTPAGLEVLGYDSDTVFPTVVITDAQGIIVFADLTDNYRVRPEPATFMHVLDGIA